MKWDYFFLGTAVLGYLWREGKTQIKR